MTRLRVIVDQRRCASSGNCADIAPAVFTQETDTGVSVVLQAVPGPESHEAVRRAARLCPAQAIRIVEEDDSGTP